MYLDVMHVVCIVVVFVSSVSYADTTPRSCRCPQCQSFNDSIRRCECCFYHLQGKRAGQDTNTYVRRPVIHAQESAKTVPAALTGADIWERAPRFTSSANAMESFSKIWPHYFELNLELETKPKSGFKDTEDDIASVIATLDKFEN